MSFSKKTQKKFLDFHGDLQSLLGINFPAIAYRWRDPAELAKWNIHIVEAQKRFSNRIATLQKVIRKLCNNEALVGPMKLPDTLYGQAGIARYETMLQVSERQIGVIRKKPVTSAQFLKKTFENQRVSNRSDETEEQVIFQEKQFRKQLKERKQSFQKNPDNIVEFCHQSFKEIFEAEHEKAAVLQYIKFVGKWASHVINLIDRTLAKAQNELYFAYQQYLRKGFEPPIHWQVILLCAVNIRDIKRIQNHLQFGLELRKLPNIAETTIEECKRILHNEKGDFNKEYLNNRAGYYLSEVFDSSLPAALNDLKREYKNLNYKVFNDMLYNLRAEVESKKNPSQEDASVEIPGTLFDSNKKHWISDNYSSSKTLHNFLDASLFHQEESEGAAKNPSKGSQESPPEAKAGKNYLLQLINREYALWGNEEQSESEQNPSRGGRF